MLFYPSLCQNFAVACLLFLISALEKMENTFLLCNKTNKQKMVTYLNVFLINFFLKKILKFFPSYIQREKRMHTKQWTVGQIHWMTIVQDPENFPGQSRELRNASQITALKAYTAYTFEKNKNAYPPQQSNKPSAQKTRTSGPGQEVDLF